MDISINAYAGVCTVSDVDIGDVKFNLYTTHSLFPIGVEGCVVIFFVCFMVTIGCLWELGFVGWMMLVNWNAKTYKVNFRSCFRLFDNQSTFERKETI